MFTLWLCVLILITVVGVPVTVHWGRWRPDPTVWFGSKDNAPGDQTDKTERDGSRESRLRAGVTSSKLTK